MLTVVVRSLGVAMGQGLLFLPLVTLFIVPFYCLPLASPPESQIQIFQLLAILCFVLSNPKGETYKNPFAFLVLLAMAQLIWAPVTERLGFHIQMIIISYAYFLACVRSRVDFKWVRRTVVLLFLITSLYSMGQWWEINCLPSYMNPQKARHIFGVWGVQAFCASFLVLTVPFIMELRSLIIKLLFLSLLVFMLKYTSSSFAFLGSLTGLVWWWILRRKRIDGLVISCLVLVGISIAFYIKGDVGVDALKRIDVWRMTLGEIIKSPLLGYSFGTFLQFGFSHTFPLLNNGLFFAQAHNELLQLWYEAGIMGLIIGLWFIGDVIKRAHPVLTPSLMGFFVVSLGQPVLHTMHLSVIAIALYGFLISETNKENSDVY